MWSYPHIQIYLIGWKQIYPKHNNKYVLRVPFMNDMDTLKHKK
jgi:hypothetical protein